MSEHSQSQARAAVESIVEMIEAYHLADDEGEAEYNGDMCDVDEMREYIEQDALSVQVRSDWHSPGNEGEYTEYMILLSTGGPATRIIGELGRYNEPENAKIQHQDWFEPWMDYRDTSAEEDDALLEYARFFWFGE